MNFKAPGMLFFYYKKTCKKKLFVMKITTMLILSACLHISAKGFGQKINIEGKDMPLEKVFSLIEKEAGYVFFFNYDVLRDTKTVTINIKDANIEEAMTACLKGQPLEFKIVDKTITIARKKEVKIAQRSAFAFPPFGIVGIVRDENGSPLAGATVILNSLNKSGLTNEKGEFVMQNVPNGKYILEISFVGYEKYRTQIVISDNTIKLFAEMKHLINLLDETQVIAYGTTTKRFNTGNVTTVKGEDIAKQPVNNPLLALEGQVPGLFITQASGLPGAGVTVRIQGQNSILNGTDPLYVIDGVPFTSQLPSTYLDGILGNGSSGGRLFGNSIGAGNPLNYLNPGDIESIEILKDADATAIYGSRAANGAILITTKKGKVGATKVDINLQQGGGKVTRKLDMLKTQQYLQMRHEAINNDGLMPDSTRDYDLLLWDTTRYTDWQKALIGGTAQYSNVNATFSGGNATSQYLIGGAWHRETTVFPGSFADQKGSVHFSINNNSENKRFHILFSGNYMIDNNYLPNQDLTESAIQMEPDAPHLRNQDGSLNWAPDPNGNATLGANPIQYLYNIYKNKTKNLIGNAALGYKILPGLEIRSNFGYTDIQTDDFIAEPLTSIPPYLQPYIPRNASYGNRNLETWIIEPQASYDRVIGKGKLDVLVGGTIEEDNTNITTIQGTGYNSDRVLQNIGAASSLLAYTPTNSQYKYSAIFGRLNYSWGGEYIIDLNARKDGSSRFGPQNQFHNFGSLGVAWIFTEEGLLKKGLPFLSFGKLKGSYGTTGSDQIGDYTFLNLYYNNSFGNPYQGIVGLAPGGFSNPYLQWEETTKLQAGIDLGFLKDKILLNTTFARNQSSDQLLSSALPGFTGFASVLENLPATVQNTDWEFSLETKNIRTHEITWTSRINLTIPRNKIIKFPNIGLTGFASGNNGVIVGQPLGIIKAFHFLGVDPGTGQYRFADSHGNPTLSPNSLTDQNTLISLLPKYYGGFQNTFDFKGFQLDILFNFVKQIGSNVYFFNGLTFPGQFASGYSNQPSTVLNRWQKPGDKVAIAEYSTTIGQYSALGSDFNYTDASYIRLRNLAMSYQLPSALLKRAHLRACRVYMQGQNLLTITKYEGMDPENQGTTSLPPLRVWTLGIELGL